MLSDVQSREKVAPDSSIQNCAQCRISASAHLCMQRPHQRRSLIVTSLKALHTQDTPTSRWRRQGRRFDPVCTNRTQFDHLKGFSDLEGLWSEQRLHIHLGLKNKANLFKTASKHKSTSSCLCCHNSLVRHSCGPVSPLTHGSHARQLPALKSFFSDVRIYKWLVT